ncbi:hypothetical protein HELRODRAFT_177969 [Helobdella robusta]|uniref:Apple domain-containing protein n=1 Tax=Helobdella robusta TaxID=6412 RepID=T1FCJ5_HELRO|nr:hypothetical protein HELRODRAFT_177969 [Helobdella robusta]ESN97538.1 hypothetical protein HELRODRAFT_177969 [Helobdella robusta]
MSPKKLDMLAFIPISLKFLVTASKSLPSFNSFSPYKNSFGLKTCAVDVADEQFVFSYDSRVKCVAMCSAVVGCVGCNYHLDRRVCQLFKNRTKLGQVHDAAGLCTFHEKSGNQLLHDGN